MKTKTTDPDNKYSENSEIGDLATFLCEFLKREQPTPEEISHGRQIAKTILSNMKFFVSSKEVDVNNLK